MVKIGVYSLAVLFVGLSLSHMDGRIARYNINRYLAGTLGDGVFDAADHSWILPMKELLSDPSLLPDQKAVVENHLYDFRNDFDRILPSLYYKDDFWGYDWEEAELSDDYTAFDELMVFNIERSGMMDFYFSR